MVNTIENNSQVKVHYTGTLADGKVFDTNEGDAPLEVTLGEGKLIKGFEQNLMGMKVNEEKTFTLQPEEAYGQNNPELVQRVPRNKFPQNITPQTGHILTLRTPDGHTVQAQVKEVANDAVTLDLNHPLAGKALTFKIKVVEIA